MAAPARLTSLAQWVALGAAVGVVCGAASALFLWLLDEATATRVAHGRLVWLLPVAGLGIGLVYDRFGRSIRAGNSLVIDTVHTSGPQLPVRMAPMVLLGTVLTHLFGGSAGREGTAVQMGASLADTLSHRLRLSPALRRDLLAAGIAGGFGSVFGTPIAGALFALEVVVIGRLSYEPLVPALVAAFVGDAVTRALGIEHSPYPLVSALPVSLLVVGKWLVFAAAVAGVAVLFVEATHRLKALLERRLPSLALRMAVGGVAVVAIWQLSGTDDYLGLSIPTLLRAFGDPALPVSAFGWKLLLTVVTLAAGFLGGEVTPLFVIGGCLGNVIGRWLGLPLDLATGVGMAATFGAAANTPLALTVMALELMGSAVLPHVLLVCVVAYLCTGHRGIYPSQRVLRRKHGGPPLHAPLTLHELRSKRE